MREKIITFFLKNKIWEWEMSTIFVKLTRHQEMT